MVQVNTIVFNGRIIISDLAHTISRKRELITQNRTDIRLSREKIYFIILLNTNVTILNTFRCEVSIIMNVRNNLRILMARDRLTIQDVHDKTGLSRTTISKLYNETSAKIGFETIVALCTLFNCGVEELLYLEEEKDHDNA